ncbi:transposable element Tcb2 transposase [Trichonephila clavipes]|nr:transposable element Tcb2 transposase [Trichonephila clavipes]
MSNHQRSDDGMRWRIVGSSRILDPARESLDKVVQEVRLPEKIAICRLQRGVPKATASQFSRYLYAATGTRVSRVIILKRLHERGLFSRRPAVCVSLTSTNRRVRLAWCRQHRDWNMDQWATILFTDE